MRSFAGLVLALALGVMGYSETSGTGGSGGSGICESRFQCNDGDRCTDDAGVSGQCRHYPNTCDDLIECTVDTCEPEVGCRNTAIADGTPCTGGACQGGACELAGSVLPCVEQAIRNAVAAGVVP